MSPDPVNPDPGGEAPVPAPGDPPPPVTRPQAADLRTAFFYLVYDLAWSLLLVVFSPWWLTKMALSPGFRAMADQRLVRSTPRLGPPDGRPRVLVHGVSVGEVKASLSLVQELRETCEVLVSASTDTGMQVARQLYPDLPVVRWPLDHAWIVRRFFRHLRPDGAVLMELEIWPNFLRRANRDGVPVAIVSGRITASSFANYQRFGRTLPQFNRVTLFAAQNEEYAQRFVGLGGAPERVVVTGNVKVDGLRVGRARVDPEFRRLAAVEGAGPVLVAGSTHEPEEVMVTRAFRNAAPGARVVLAPRHPPRADSVVTALAAEGVRVQRLTDLRAGHEAPDPSRPLLVDTIGEMDNVYGLATLVFVGGSLIEHGGQNMLEPAAQGLPVLYGPHVTNFPQEAQLLEQAGGAARVADAGELEAEVRALLADPERCAAMGQAALEAVRSQGGATARTLEALRARCAFPPPEGPGA